MPRINERVAVLCALFLSQPAVAAENEATRDPEGRSVSIAAEAFQPRSGSDEIPFTRYDGSLFGVLSLGGDRVICFGLRGNIFTSDDRGETWASVTPPDSPGLSYYGGGHFDSGGVVLVGAGGVMTSSLDGTEFTSDIHSGRSTFSMALLHERDLLLVGMAGITKIPAARGNGQ